MRPFFNSHYRIEQLMIAAESWRGTPFRPHGKVKGPRGGCSCETLAGEIGKECGWLPRETEFPKGSLRTWRAQRKSQIVPFIETIKHLELIDYGPKDCDPMAGDVIWFTDDNCEHLGTMLSETEFIHTMLHCKASVARIDDATFTSCIERAWRPVE